MQTVAVELTELVSFFGEKKVKKKESWTDGGSTEGGRDWPHKSHRGRSFLAKAAKAIRPEGFKPDLWIVSEMQV